MTKHPALAPELAGLAHPGGRIPPPALLILLCVLFSALRWLKTESFWGDSSRWIFEAWRAASGELPYRDFAWQYPPLSLLVFGGAFHVFGASFTVAQIVIDIISSAIVLLSWRVARLLFSPGLAFAAAATLACAGSGNTGNFALFSLQMYTPALLVGMVGLLMVLEALIVQIQSGSLSRGHALLLSAGATIALLSKPEFLMGTVGALGGAAIYQWRLGVTNGQPSALWLQKQMLVVGLAVLPALTIYGVLAWTVGLDNLMAGLSGYGIAYLVCPWWPTGLGLFGAFVALCQSAMALLIVNGLWHRDSNPPSRTTIMALRVPAVLAIPATVLYIPYCLKEFPILAGEVTPVRMMSFFLSTGTVLLPVMWSSIVFCPALAVKVGLGRNVRPEAGVFLILSTAGLLMSARTLFGGTLSQLTLVTAAAYPIWFIVAPLLVERFLHGSKRLPLRHASAPVIALVTAYGLLRFGTAILVELRSGYTTIDTAAHRVRVLDHTNSAAVYRYVLDHTSDTDRVLDISYGGAVNFASRRTSPLYSTQFSALAPAQKYLSMDLERIRAHPPKLIIANAAPDFGATYGMCVETGCTFPAIVWRSKRLACEPDRKFPVLEYIKTHYAPVARVGEKVIYSQESAPKAPEIQS